MVDDISLDQHNLDDVADRGGRQRRQHHRHHERYAERMREREGDVSAEHVESAVGEVDDAEDAEDQREADGDQRVLRSEAEPDHAGRYESFHGRVRSPAAAGR